jgi:hypothetical protein
MIVEDIFDLGGMVEYRLHVGLDVLGEDFKRFDEESRVVMRVEDRMVPIVSDRITAEG